VKLRNMVVSLLCAVLMGCTTTSQKKTTKTNQHVIYSAYNNRIATYGFGYVSGVEVIAKNRADAKSVSRKLAQIKMKSKSAISALDFDYFKVSQRNDNSQFGAGNVTYQRWLGANQHRAMAFGIPEQCASIHTVHSMSTMRQAAQLALSGCHRKLKYTLADYSKSCSCKLAIADNIAFVTPDEFKNRNMLFAVLQIEENNSRNLIESRIIFDGVPSSTQGIEIINEKGAKLCEGEVASDGTSRLSCFKGAREFSGHISFIINDQLQDELKGNGEMQGENTKMKIIFGYEKSDFFN